MCCRYNLFFTGIHVRTHVNGNSQSPSPYHGQSPHYSPNSYHNHDTSPSYQYGRFDASALHIAHALKQTELQKSYNKVNREKPIDCYLVSIFPFFLLTCFTIGLNLRQYRTFSLSIAQNIQLAISHSLPF